MNRLCLTIVIGLAGAVALSACKSGCVSLFTPSAELVDSPIVDELREESGGEKPGGEKPGGEKPAGAGELDHSSYAELLQDYVDYDTARVDYAGLKSDQAKLDAYLDEIARADLEGLGDDASLALLINAYNAFTLKLVVEHYPDLDTIKDIDSPWKTTRWVVGGHKLSLDDIEHGLIRPLYRDSRIHFAVNCASIGCPPLADWPYEGDKLDDQLDRAARRTLGDERYARVEGDKLLLTSVMNWYRRDFVGDEFSPTADTLPLYAARYASEEVRGLVEAKDGEPVVGFIDYDWSLNDSE